MRTAIIAALTLITGACDMPEDSDLQPLDEEIGLETESDTESDTEPPIEPAETDPEQETDPSEPEPEPEPIPEPDLGETPPPQPPVDPLTPHHNRPPTDDGLPPVQVGDFIPGNMLPDRTAYAVNCNEWPLMFHVLQTNLTWTDILTPGYEAKLNEYAATQREAWGVEPSHFLIAAYRFD